MQLAAWSGRYVSKFAQHNVRSEGGYSAEIDKKTGTDSVDIFISLHVVKAENAQIQAVLRIHAALRKPVFRSG